MFFNVKKTLVILIVQKAVVLGIKKNFSLQRALLKILKMNDELPILKKVTDEEDTHYLILLIEIQLIRHILYIKLI